VRAVTAFEIVFRLLGTALTVGAAFYVLRHTVDAAALKKQVEILSKWNSELQSRVAELGTETAAHRDRLADLELVLFEDEEPAAAPAEKAN
jgi:hypothetical protein